MNHFVSRTYRRSLYHVCSHEATCVLELLLGLSRTAVHLHIYGTLRVSHCSSVSRRGSSYHHRPRPAYRWPPTRLPRLFTKKRKSPRSARSALHKNSLRKHTRTSAEPRARGIFKQKKYQTLVVILLLLNVRVMTPQVVQTRGYCAQCPPNLYCILVPTCGTTLVLVALAWEATLNQTVITQF